MSAVNLERPKAARGGAMQQTEQSAEIVAKTDFRAKARQAKLRQGLANLANGKLATATGILLEVYAERPLTPEGLEALEALSRLADEHEAAGRHRLAMELYAKLAED
jgi:hypothetical protein